MPSAGHGKGLHVIIETFKAPGGLHCLVSWKSDLLVRIMFKVSETCVWYEVGLKLMHWL